MRRPLSSKSGTCTESTVVDAAGISVKVGVHYPGRSVDLPLVLMTSRGVVMDRQKSAEGIVGVSTALKART